MFFPAHFLCNDMTPLFKKLNFKNQPAVLSINHPDSFLPELKAMGEITNVVDSIGKLKLISFAIVFANQTN
jgi:hypothetical protein